MVAAAVKPISGMKIVRRVAPHRTALLVTLGLALAALAAWLSFDYGRAVAGFSSNSARGERGVLLGHITDLKAEVRELRVQLAGAESARLSQLRERTEVARTIGELQAQLDIAQRDLQFYRGIANPRAPSGAPVSVQQFSVLTESAAERRYTIRLALSRESRREDLVNGKVLLTVEGTNAGSQVRADIGNWPFSFKYFSSIEQQITLPAGLVVERVTIEVRTSGTAVAPYRKTFVWNPVS
jgi:hypothetical protein